MARRFQSFNGRCTRPSPQRSSSAFSTSLISPSLIVIVICSSYENFLAPIDPRRHPDCPEGVAGPAEVAEVLNMTAHMRGLCGCYA
jgi:hypothetical protein